VRSHVAGADDRERYNAFVAASPLADPLQAFEWGEVKSRSGWEPLRLFVEDSGEILGTCSVLLTRPAPGFPPIAYAPRGPVLDYSHTEVLETLLGSVRERCGKAFVFACDPPVESGSPAAQQLAARLRNVASGGFGGVQPKAIMVLNLGDGLDQILANFKSKWRYNVRLAERKGVSVRQGERSDLDVFYDLLRTTAVRDRFAVRGRTYFEDLWDVLHPANMLQLFIAEFEGRALAAIILFCMGNRATYVYGASSDEHRNLMPNHLIQWEAIRWAKESGFSIYDFQGVSPMRGGEPAEPELAGLNRFKEGFGAEYMEYAGQFDLPLRSLWYSAWRTLYPPAIALARRLRRA
jgi:peptidoglycan pentaglycine glycine transferase (the first glycine)